MGEFGKALRHLCGALCALGWSTVAFAADLPVKASPLGPVAYNWTGVYGGVHAGYGAGMKDWSNSNFDYIAKGPFGGVQLGVNQQIGNWLIGLEGDVSWDGVKNTQTIVVGGQRVGFTTAASATSSIESLATVAGRLGFTSDRWLVYVKGGAAWAHESHTFSILQQSTPPFAPVSAIISAPGAETRFGGMIGVGAEYAFLGHWSGKVEYNYLDFAGGARDVRFLGSQTFVGITTPIAFTALIPQHVHLLKLGLNYRFGPDAPPSIAPSSPVAGFDWSGAYVGAQAAYGTGRKRWTNFDPNGEFDVKGGLAGGVIGANAQSGVFVVGVEGEGLWSGVKGGSNFGTLAGQVFSLTHDFSSKIDWLAMATARVGFVASDRWLVYGKGGLAIAHEQHKRVITQASPGIGSIVDSLSGDALHTGAVAGVGVEYAFLGNWSAKLEYDYIAFRQQDVQLVGTELANIPPVGTTGINQRISIRQDLHLVKFGIDYHFGPGPDVVRARD
jgi:opacity protein-like surface antigen